ncbi:helix-turn-helix domain-containing protein [Streptomyces sp. NPDC057638]|uniref:helix-turn-helix domain-containing protein n=1 Tax=Streptomyces sp. NPDC057638 TaxID=3346190 RepID=UPI0036878B0C
MRAGEFAAEQIGGQGRGPLPGEVGPVLEKVFDSQELPTAEREDAWHHVTGHALTVDRSVDFRATLQVIDLGAAQVSAVTYSPLNSLRSATSIRRDDPEILSVALTVRGHKLLNQNGRRARLDAGDLVAYTSVWPYEASTDVTGVQEGTAASIVAEVPRTLLPLPANQIDRLLATPLPGRDGMGALLSHFLTHLVADTSPYRPADGPRLGVVLLDLITALLAHHLDDPPIPSESRQHALFLRIQAFVHQHLGDPQLTPSTIAAAHHISIRYLYKLFHQHGLAVAEWIRTRRLERCHRELADPRLRTVPIHAIAARWGFTDSANFSRAFRAAYAISPKEFRALALAATVLTAPKALPARPEH